jgi:hypothetical protein
VIEVYGPTRHLLARSDDGFIGDPETAYVHVGTSGRYSIRVSSFVGSRSPGSYTVGIDPIDPPPGAGFDFEPYQAYGVGSWPEAVAIGDVTGDGLSDS